MIDRRSRPILALGRSACVTVAWATTLLATSNVLADSADINLGDDAYLYQRDTGEAFGDRDGGLKYGWTQSTTTGEAERPRRPAGPPTPHLRAADC